MLTMEMFLHKDVDFAPKFGKNPRFGRNCCHSCHRVVADCVSMLNGLQEPLHPSCNRATLIVFESLITNSLKAQRFFNYFEKLKKRWEKLMKHLAIREGENFFCEGEI